MALGGSGDKLANLLIDAVRCVYHIPRNCPHCCYEPTRDPNLANVKDTEPQVGGKSPRMVLAKNSFCAWDGETLVLNILGTPSAKRDAIGKAKGNQLKVSVTATPVAGKATDHMVRFLAKEFEVATNDIEVVFGRFNVNKQLRIKSPKNLPPVISKHLSEEVA